MNEFTSFLLQMQGILSGHHLTYVLFYNTWIIDAELRSPGMTPPPKCCFSLKKQVEVTQMGQNSFTSRTRINVVISIPSKGVKIPRSCYSGTQHESRNSISKGNWTSSPTQQIPGISEQNNIQYISYHQHIPRFIQQHSTNSSLW